MNYFLVFVAMAASCGLAYAGDAKEDCKNLMKPIGEMIKLQMENLPECAQSMIPTPEDFSSVDNMIQFRDGKKGETKEDLFGCMDETHESMKEHRDKIFELRGEILDALTDECLTGMHAMLGEIMESMKKE